MFESGAILIYLAEKVGRFYPTPPRERYLTLQWLMFQMGSVGPMLGQTHHFRRYAPEEIPYAIDRYTNEAARLYRVMNSRLSEAEYFAGEYSIADIAIYPLTVSYETQGQTMEDFPNLMRWYENVEPGPQSERHWRSVKSYAGRLKGWIRRPARRSSVPDNTERGSRRKSGGYLSLALGDPRPSSPGWWVLRYDIRLESQSLVD